MTAADFHPESGGGLGWHVPAADFHPNLARRLAELGGTESEGGLGWHVPAVDGGTVTVFAGNSEVLVLAPSVDGSRHAFPCSLEAAAALVSVLARPADTTDDDWELLSCDRNATVRRLVARSPHAPEHARSAASLG